MQTIVALPGGFVLAYIGDGQVLRSDDRGGSWKLVDTGLSRQMTLFISAAFTDGKGLVVLAGNYGIPAALNRLWPHLAAGTDGGIGPLDCAACEWSRRTGGHDGLPLRASALSRRLRWALLGKRDPAIQSPNMADAMTVGMRTGRHRCSSSPLQRDDPRLPGACGLCCGRLWTGPVDAGLGGPNARNRASTGGGRSYGRDTEVSD